MAAAGHGGRRRRERRRRRRRKGEEEGLLQVQLPRRRGQERLLRERGRVGLRREEHHQRYAERTGMDDGSSSVVLIEMTDIAHCNVITHQCGAQRAAHVHFLGVAVRARGASLPALPP